jgi:hypothetical protein
LWGDLTLASRNLGHLIWSFPLPLCQSCPEAELLIVRFHVKDYKPSVELSEVEIEEAKLRSMLSKRTMLNLLGANASAVKVGYYGSIDVTNKGLTLRDFSALSSWRTWCIL